ncbi:MAG TPA: hypothetical protein VFM60_01530 [Salinimicrobium sp.]|nr:hypothetical protein [Salinimicrobium sp.]
MKTIKTIVFLSFMLISSTAIAQDFDEFDSNTDGMIDSDEFSETYSSELPDWDGDGDGMLDDQEFNDLTFNRIDVDQDGNISEEDWNDNYEMYGDFYESEDFNQFDQDGDKIIEPEEYNDYMEESGYMENIDSNMDGVLDEEELDESLFDDFDENDDDFLDEEEFWEFQDLYDQE